MFFGSSPSDGLILVLVWILHCGHGVVFFLKEIWDIEIGIFLMITL